jgi:hypothetical protein
VGPRRGLPFVEPVLMKKCKVCGQYKDEEAYPPHPKSKDGLFHTCGGCLGQKISDSKLTTEAAVASGFEEWQKRTRATQQRKWLAKRREEKRLYGRPLTHQERLAITGNSAEDRENRARELRRFRRLEREKRIFERTLTDSERLAMAVFIEAFKETHGYYPKPYQIRQGVERLESETNDGR